jgi:hypothetical protein
VPHPGQPKIAPLVFFLSKNRGAKPPGNENNITTKDKCTGGLTSN